MTQVFFKYQEAPYLFDTTRLKLYQMKAKSLSEIVEPTVLHGVRFHSIEINKKAAIHLARRWTKEPSSQLQNEGLTPFETS